MDSIVHFMSFHYLLDSYYLKVYITEKTSAHVLIFKTHYCPQTCVLLYSMIYRIENAIPGVDILIFIYSLEMIPYKYYWQTKNQKLYRKTRLFRV